MLHALEARVGLSGAALAWMSVLAVAILIAAFVAARMILLHLPACYFEAHDPPPRAQDEPPLRATLRRVGKNALGVVLVAVGVVMAVPGVPGPGIVTIAVGLLLVDFPGKRALERGLVRRPHVLAALNAFRRRHGREPFAAPRSA